MSEIKLPRRDWLLLPLAGLLTVYVIVVGFGAVAGRLFPEVRPSTGNCLIVDDRSTGTRAIPNTRCVVQGAEAGRIEYRYNSCGHRAGVECGPKPEGTYRIVMMGSSINFGMWVAQDKTFAALLPAELSRRSGRRIELYNESMLGGWPRSADLRLKEVFAAEPDLILWVLCPRDIRNSSMVVLSDLNPATENAPEAVRGGGFLARLRYRIQASFAGKSSGEAASAIWDHLTAWLITTFTKSPSGILLQHMVYSSRTQYVKSYLLAPETDTDSSDPGFLRADLSEKWRSHLQTFETYADDIEERARAAGVPLVAVLVPDRAQAAMISSGAWPQGYDPYRINDDVRAIITRHGGTYLDILGDFRSIPNPERGYLPVDGHPDSQGHAMIATLLTKALTGGAVPALSGATPALPDGVAAPGAAER